LQYCFWLIFNQYPVVMNIKKRFLLRLDTELFESLEKWAGDELRSVNAQMEYLLTEAARKAGRLQLPQRHRHGSRERVE
jgi:hypothetical protein